jgi:hypothetical protein
MKHAGPIIVGLCLIFLLGSCVWAFFSYARSHDLSVIEAISALAQETRSGLTSSNINSNETIEGIPFEKLLTTSTDGVVRGMDTTKIDMQERKGFFTAKGWAEYEAYLAAHTKRLQMMSGSPLNASGHIDEDTTMMDTASGGAQKKLTAKGLFLHSYGEFYGRPYDAFTIEVTYSDPASAEGSAIDHWALTFDGVPQ